MLMYASYFRSRSHSQLERSRGLALQKKRFQKTLRLPLKMSSFSTFSFRDYSMWIPSSFRCCKNWVSKMIILTFHHVESSSISLEVPICHSSFTAYNRMEKKNGSWYLEEHLLNRFHQTSWRFRWWRVDCTTNWSMAPTQRASQLWHHSIDHQKR